MSAFARLGLVLPFAFLVSAPMAFAEGDPVAGERIFQRCAVCHGIGDTERQPGPNLNNLIGRVAGTQPDFTRYSANMREAGEGGLVWTAETIDPYIENPRRVIPRGNMAFQGLRNAQERADVIAYIAQFSEPAEDGEEAAD
ncbi:MAG: c-type cytochrome [Aliihoeflea sp.]